MRRVPTHAVTVANERRAYPRAKLQLPLRVTRIAGRREAELPVIQTVDISSSGLFARCPFKLEPGTNVDLEVELVQKPAGRGAIRMLTQAHVVRVEPDAKHGWHAMAFNFDDISFQRDDFMPPRFSPR
jgi:c-di-GMP-binding flagellar brake protein YcgR